MKEVIEYSVRTPASLQSTIQSLVELVRLIVYWWNDPGPEPQYLWECGACGNENLFIGEIELEPYLQCNACREVCVSEDETVPTYEYQCSNCGHEFEEFHQLRRNRRSSRCPRCRHDRIAQLYSGGIVMKKSRTQLEGRSVNHDTQKKIDEMTDKLAAGE